MNKVLIVILTILLVASSACTLTNQSGQSSDSKKLPGAKQPVAYIDSITPSEAAPGEEVSFTGHGTDVDGDIIGYEWRSDLDGMLSTIASFSTASLSTGTHKISFRVLDSQSLWSTVESSTVTIIVEVAKPVIESFVAVPGTMVQGGSVELQWSVSNVDTVTIDNGIGQVATTGSTWITPPASIEYTLTATNEGGSSIATTSVIVTQSAVAGNPVIEFTAQHLGGNSWQLNWNVQNATEMNIEPDIGPVESSGSTVVTISETTTYRLNAVNNWGWAYWDITLGALP
jgi:hypothetical protein